uniref:Uncharacterized protein n=1 Tax=Schistocephalus solidus TaxID=70667 RepID=A0A0X3PRQ3_SCHSO
MFTNNLYTKSEGGRDGRCKATCPSRRSCVLGFRWLVYTTGLSAFKCSRREEKGEKAEAQWNHRGRGMEGGGAWMRDKQGKTMNSGDACGKRGQRGETKAVNLNSKERRLTRGGGGRGVDISIVVVIQGIGELTKRTM